MKLTNGDIAINKNIALQDNIQKVAKVDLETLEKNKQLFKSQVESGKTTAKDIKEIIIADVDNDSVKYTFDNIYEDKELISVAKNYYTEREGKTYDDREAIDKFISDRTWKQANTFSIGKELLYITGEDVAQDQKSRLAYLTNVWGKLPNFYQEGGRGYVSGLAKNLGAAIVDPLNLLGGVVGGIVGKTAGKVVGKTALSQVTKNLATKKTAKKVTQDIIMDPETLAKVSKEAARKKLLATAGTISVIDGVGFAAADIAAQTTEKEIGMREKLDPKRTMLVSLGAAGTSFIATGGIGFGIQKFRNMRESQKIDGLSPGLYKTIDEGAKLTDEGLKKYSTSGATLRTNLADQYDFIKQLQRDLLGVEASAAGLKSAIESSKFAVDPVLLPYFQLRMAAAASTRAHEFIANGIFMPPSATASKASYTKGRSLGLQQILKPFDDMGEVPSFLAYVAAKRQKSLVKNNPKLKNELPLTIKEMDEIIDYGELSSNQYYRKYNKNLKRKGNYQDGASKLKVFTDELLEYQVQSGLIAREEANNILKANEFFIPLYRKKSTGVIKKISSKISEQTEQILRPTRPGAKKLAKTKQEGDLNLYDNLITYTYKAINGADRNRAKIALYEMIAKAEKLKQLDKNVIVKKTNYAVENKRAIGEIIKKKYEEAGFSIVGNEGKLPNLDVAVFSSTFKKLDSDNFIDIVYVNGKQKAYEILNKELKEAFVNFGDDTMKTFNSALGALGISWYARIASRAITYSPPFVAFNAIRDTLAGTVNSVFGLINKNGIGFVPGFTSVKGFINSFRLNNEYRKAMISGMGYSSRADSEKLLNLSTKDLLKYGAGSEQKLYAGSLKKILKMLSGGWRGWSEFVSRVEYSTRMGEFELAKKAGFGDIAAGFFGREVSTDFGMRGSNKFLKSLSRNTMFLNAGLQGLYRTGRLAVEGTVKDRARVAVTIASTIVAPEIYLYFKNRDIPEYQQLDARIRQLNYVIPTYEKGSNGNDVFDGFIFIPKPYDLGVFANLGVALVKGIQERTPEIGQRYALQSMSNILPAIPIPTALNPAFELIFNRNFYTGSVVLGMYERQTIEKLRYRAQTRELAKYTANFLSNIKGMLTIGERPGDEKDRLDPLKIDYLIGAYATGLMQYPFDIINDVFFESTDKNSSFPDFSDTDPFNYKKKGLNIKKPKATKENRKFNIKEPWTIVTNRFRSESTIQNSFFHKEWYRMQTRAKELGILDITNLSNQQEINEKQIKVFDNIVTNIDNNEPLQNKEIQAYSAMGDTYTETMNQINGFREKRKLIEIAPDMNSEQKRKIMNDILAAENLVLHGFFNMLTNIDLDYILEDSMMYGIIKNVDTYDIRKDKK
jgi:hypothetical protein